MSSGIEIGVVAIALAAELRKGFPEDNPGHEESTDAHFANKKVGAYMHIS